MERAPMFENIRAPILRIAIIVVGLLASAQAKALTRELDATQLIINCQSVVNSRSNERGNLETDDLYGAGVCIGALLSVFLLGYLSDNGHPILRFCGPRNAYI